MGALNPVFMFAVAAAAVPVVLHLLHRRHARTFVFPALRYLVRTERERSRRIRLRQLLLLALRVTALLLIVGAGARLFLTSGSSAHPPTAVAIVLDNSMSSGVVVDEERVLDRHVRSAAATLRLAGDGDRFWLVLLGEPWLVSTPLTSEEAERRLLTVSPTGAHGDVMAALERAARLLSESSLERREIHLHTDMQATGFRGGVRGPAEGGRYGVPVIARMPDHDPPANRSIASVLVGGGLAPLAGSRTSVAVLVGQAHGTTSAGVDASAQPDTDGVAGAANPTETPVSVPTATASSAITELEAVRVRAVVEGRVQGTTLLAPGSMGSIVLPASAGGWTWGHAEIDPDYLRADDHRHFAYQSLAPPPVAISGDVGVFVTEALATLEDGGRVTRASVDSAEFLVAESAADAHRLASDAAYLVLPPTDPVHLPALNRRLGELGIPWRIGIRPGVGGGELVGSDLPSPLVGAVVSEAYELQAGPNVLQVGNTGQVMAGLGGEPWIVTGIDGRLRRYLLIASPLDEISTSIPVSASMVPFIDWLANGWRRMGVRGAQTVATVAGDPIPSPPGAERVILPSGRVLPIDGTRTVRQSGETGIYSFVRGGGVRAHAFPSADTQIADPDATPDSVVALVAVVPAPEESDLTQLSSDEVSVLVPGIALVNGDREWRERVFTARRGPELDGALLIAALLLLAIEMLVAPSGGTLGSGKERYRRTVSPTR